MGSTQHWEIHSIQTSPKVMFDALKHAFKPSNVQEKYDIALACKEFVKYE